MKFTHYLALGDSISIDLYPSLDTNNTPDSKVGAASLLAKRLRETHNPALGFTNLTADGARVPAICRQVEKISTGAHGAGMLITLTAGGNDISFSAMEVDDDAEHWKDVRFARIEREWSWLVAELIARFPEATIIVNTLYDPTEGTGTFGGRGVAGAWEDIAELYSYGRGRLSEYITNAVANITGTMKVNLLLADIRGAFKGHGVTASEEDRWYYNRFMIEPNAEGARQIAGLWMDALQKKALVEFAERVRTHV